MNERCRQLEGLLHREVPLTREMGMRVQQCDGNALTLHAPLGPNINIHGSAFAGSLFSFAALASWGLIHLILEKEGHHSSIALGDGKINFHLPVRGDIEVKSRLPDADGLSRFLETYRSEGKARVTMEADIGTKEGVAVTFKGTYIAWTSTVDV